MLRTQYVLLAFITAIIAAAVSIARSHFILYKKYILCFKCEKN